MEPMQLVKAENGVSYFSIPALEQHGGVRAFFTTRQGGVSKGFFRSLNFGGYTEDDPAHVAENRRRLYEAVGLNSFTEGFVRQVHGDYVCCFQSPDMLEEDTLTINQADGSTTNLSDMLLLTLHADCLPLWFLDSQRRVIAVTHAGWRGTVKGIGSNTLDKMQETFGSRHEDVTAVIGPGIGFCCFEVGAEVVEAFQENVSGVQPYVRKKPDGKYMLDLKGINAMQLRQAGVGEVLVSGYCTKCRPDLFFSHRRDHGHTGRMAAGLVLCKESQPE